MTPGTRATDSNVVRSGMNTAPPITGNAPSPLSAGAPDQQQAETV